MRVTNAGYRDPNKLKFENITVLGVPSPPASIVVSSTSGDGASSTVSNFTKHYDSEKKVRKPPSVTGEGDIKVEACEGRCQRWVSTQGDLHLWWLAGFKGLCR